MTKDEEERIRKDERQKVCNEIGWWILTERWKKKPVRSYKAWLELATEIFMKSSGTNLRN